MTGETVLMKRAEVWWAQLPPPVGAEPGYSRPILIVSDDTFNETKIQTVIALVITSNLDYLHFDGTVYLSKEETGLDKDSVANATQCVTIDKAWLEKKFATLPPDLMAQVDESLKLVLSFSDLV